MKKTTKRVLSFVLSCVFICSGFVSTMAEESSKVSRAKNLLESLDIVEDYSCEIVTREIFADVYVKANNIYHEGYTSSNPFDDVADSLYADSIHIMRDYGLINGVGDNLFAPADNMMAKDIIRLYVSALGLDTYQEATGKDYMEVAYEVNLLKGIGVSEYITMDNFIQLTYNFLMAPMGVRNLTQQVSYSINYETNALYEKFDVYEVTGQVIQNDLSGIWSSNGADEGYVVIKTKEGEFTALAGDSGIDLMLGRTLDIYLYEGEDEHEVVCYEKKSNENSLIIDIEDIDFESSNNSVIRYREEGRSSLSSEELASFPAFIINGVYYDDGQFDFKELSKYSGKIELISTNRSDYNIVLVEAYTNYYVKNVEHYNGEMRIYDRGENEDLILNDTVYQKMEIFHPNGASASPFELKAGMLISVAKSFSSESYVRIYICDNVVEGSIKKYSTRDDSILLGDGTTYYVSPSYNLSNVKVGGLATLHLDIFGNVAWIDYDKTTTFSYGYMKEARITSDGEKVMIKAVIESDKFTTMYLANKTMIDGINIKYPDAQLIDLEGVEKITNLAAGEYPFRYRLNDEGEIREIDTPRVRNGYEDKDSFRVTSSGQKVICSNDKILGKETPLSSNTVMFLVPEATATDELEEPKFHKIGTSSLLNTGGDNTYTAFKIGDDSLYVDLVVRTQKNVGGGMNHDNVLFLVDEIQEIYDENESEIRLKVTGLEAGAKKEYFVHEICDRTNLEGIKRGDVLRFAFSEGEISDVDKVFIYNEDTSTDTGKYHLPSGGQKASSLSQIGTSYYYAGYVMRREGKLIEILPFDLNATSQEAGVLVPNTPDFSIDTRRVFEAPNGISIYDPSLGKGESVYAGDLEDIPTYEDGNHYAKVIVRYRSRSAREMIVLKDESLF